MHTTFIDRHNTNERVYKQAETLANAGDSKGTYMQIEPLSQFYRQQLRGSQE